MMKKYNKPEIVTLALDAVDVIETSTGVALAKDALTAKGYTKVASLTESIDNMNDIWNW